jgi:hypothetical protein
MLLYALTISVSAFLLFEVQPVIAKMILPWFGGSSGVWSTCMLFFQLVLVLGYAYAHWLSKLAPRKQAVAHISLLAVSLVALPIIPNPAWKHSGIGQPSLTILALLLVTVGLPYFVLSSTSPLLQAWYACTHPLDRETARGASRAAEERRSPAPKAPVPRLDGRLLQYVQHSEVGQASGLSSGLSMAAQGAA